MPLSWNEIRHNAINFSREWAEETREEAEAKTFWNEFFEVFGVRRRTVASFEEPVKKISGDYGYIDLFWPGVLIVEHKSLGKSLSKAESQAFRYIQDLARDEKRRKEIPRYVIVSDFAKIAIHDLEPEDQRASHEFPLAEFHRHIHEFAFIPGYKQHKFAEQDPINIEAAEILGELHDALEAGGYEGDHLERFLVRVLFCLFAEDTGIFERESFRLYVENRTAADGSDLGSRLAQLFETLNTAPANRQRNLDETLTAFPYVNGELFGEYLGFADFNRAMRDALLACCAKDWSRISPAIFGSLFQSIMQAKSRRQIGAHYTSERDILKVVRSLFLDDLRAEFETRKADRSTGRKARLEEFHKKLCALRFLDPACGCGNFLVITYRELRQLELETLKELFGAQTEMKLDVNRLSQVDVDQFYGIEIGDWAARIAEVALWLMDHQMNLKISEAFGQLYQRIPLKKSPHIHCANALRLDWKSVLAVSDCSYILGNPPFVGKHYQNESQRADMLHVFRGSKNIGDIDYVAAWFYRAAEYIQNTRIKVGFVATNSITQGEQVPIIWGLLFTRLHIKIHFAHRTFPWTSEARGKAHVHVVIIGFANYDTPTKYIFDYDAIHTRDWPDDESPTLLREEPSSREKIANKSAAGNISAYLTPGTDVFITKRQKPLADVPGMRCGNKPSDGGNLILTDEEKTQFLKAEPGAKKFLRRYTGSEEFINGNMRWCLWLADANPAELRALPLVMERIERVKAFREKSSAEPTRKATETPTLFFYISQPKTDYILIPEVSSERREYIPIGFVSKNVISANTNFLIPSSSPFHFGILTSEMHMAWVRQVAGRLESRYRYSGSMVYNNFPWPEPLTAKSRAAVEEKAQAVLANREPFFKTGSTLADLYDPLTMPPALRRAHTALDRAVDLCYRKEPFANERQRVEFLFALYERLTAPLLPTAKKSRRRKT